MNFVNTRFRLIARRDVSLKRAPKILEKNLRKGLEVIGKRLMMSARTRMRKDLGTSQKSLKAVVEGQGMDLKLVVFSTLVQSIIDAYGLKRGIWPNTRPGSPLYKWSMRRAKGIGSKRIREKNLGAVPGPNLKRIKRVKKPRSGPVSSRSRKKAQDTDTRRLAYLTARHIYKNGIRPTFWNRKALEANKNRITRELQNSIARTVNEINRG